MALRLFVAVQLPDPLRSRLAAHAERLAGAGRVVAAAQGVGRLHGDEKPQSHRARRQAAVVAEVRSARSTSRSRAASRHSRSCGVRTG